MSDLSSYKVAARALAKVVLRLATLVLIAAVVGSFLNSLAARVQSAGEPAGFWKGMVQGALMPMAFPNLLLGRDVTIYAQSNTGIHYKLGYTAGVNVCGAIFFSLLFWRLRKWQQWAVRRKARERGELAKDAAKI